MTVGDITPRPDAPPVAAEEMRARLRAVGEPMRLLESLVAHAPVALQVYARSGRCVLVSPFHRTLFGATRPTGSNVCDDDDTLAALGLTEQLALALAGEHGSVPVRWYDLRDQAATRRIAVNAELIPLSHESGNVEHVLVVYHDVTARERAREQAEAAAAEAELARNAAQMAVDHASFLAEAGRALSASLDYETTLAQVARLATPRLADFCIVDLLAEDGTIRRVAAVHAQADAQPILDELCQKFPPGSSSPQPAMRVINERKPELLRETDPAVIAEHTVNAEHRALMTRLAVRSHLAVPLLLGDRTLGAISLGYVGSRRYRITDIPLAEALASRSAVAIQNARLYRAAELARVEAESANRTKDEFLAMLGHELRNPLAPIITALELTREREGPSRERDIIERQVQHVRRLVDDLLDVARIARGKLELSRAPMEIALALFDGAELARPLIDERRHTLNIDCPEQGLLVFADRTRLAQVVANLLTNAARYSEPNGTIRMSAEARDRHIILRVKDCGIGISAELLPRIYELFAQAKQTPERSSGGLGLGLAIVKSLVEQHGGEVHARSDGPGHGAEFEVTLPRLPSGHSTAPASAIGTASEARAGARILIVDDNEDAAVLLADALALRGYLTEVAHDPNDALARAQANTPDLALLDIGLPGMDGYELARLLRSDSALAKTALVALTGYGQAGDRARSLAAGFAEHLVKPVDLQQLTAVIARLLQSTR